jgi:hypothetical protein
VDWLQLIALAIIILAGVGIAAYLILRRLFIQASEGVTRHIALALDDVTRAAASTRTGQEAFAAATRFATGRMSNLDAYAATEHVSEDAARQQFYDSIEKIARVMDSAVKIPLIGPVGMDAVLGLFPFVGDTVSAAVSVSLIAKSIRYGIPREIVTKMLANVLFDLLMGAVPIVGDIADIWFRANTRNVRLLRQYLEDRVDPAQVIEHPPQKP